MTKNPLNFFLATSLRWEIWTGVLLFYTGGSYPWKSIIFIDRFQSLTASKNVKIYTIYTNICYPKEAVIKHPHSSKSINVASKSSVSTVLNISAVQTADVCKQVLYILYCINSNSRLDLKKYHKAEYAAPGMWLSFGPFVIISMECSRKVFRLS